MHEAGLPSRPALPDSCGGGYGKGDYRLTGARDYHCTMPHKKEDNEANIEMYIIFFNQSGDPPIARMRQSWTNSKRATQNNKL